MTRSWTDPRTGKRWQIDVLNARRSAGSKRPGRGGPSESSAALLFENSGTSYSLPTEDAARLEALEDEQLAELLDQARDGDSPQEDLRDSDGSDGEPGGGRTRGPGKASPSAAGRESQPHRSPETAE